jgi:ATP-dependent DNA ligase
MPRFAKRYSNALGLPGWISLQLTQLSEPAPSGAQCMHEVKLDGRRIARAMRYS